MGLYFPIPRMISPTLPATAAAAVLIALVSLHDHDSESWRRSSSQRWMSDSRYNTRPRTSPLRLYFGPLLHVAHVAIVRTVTPNRSAAWARV